MLLLEWRAECLMFVDHMSVEAFTAGCWTAKVHLLFGLAVPALVVPALGAMIFGPLLTDAAVSLVDCICFLVINYSFLLGRCEA